MTRTDMIRRFSINTPAPEVRKRLKARGIEVTLNHIHAVRHRMKHGYTIKNGKWH